MKHFFVFFFFSTLMLYTGINVRSQTINTDQHQESAALKLAEELLKQSDQSRNDGGTYTVMTQIKSFEDGELTDEGSFEVFLKGANKTLVKFLNADVKGQYLLMLDDAMWIYMPGIRKPIRITPMQRLMGDAANGDIARTNYAEDYNAMMDGDDILNGTPCYVLLLTAKRDGATYQKIKYWITKQDTLPKRAEMFLTSGKHFKTVLFDKYASANGRFILQQITILDMLREGRITKMIYSEYAPKEIPEKYFHKDYLEKMR